MNGAPDRFGKNKIPEMKKTAKFALRPVYGEAVAVIIIRGCVAIPMLGFVGMLFFQRELHYVVAVYTGIWIFEALVFGLLSGALSVGAARYFCSAASLRDPQIIQLFDGFRNYRDTVAMCLLRALYIILWSALFIVPGVIAALRYAMAPYIMAVKPGIKAADALRISKEMMRGRKRVYFRFLLSFAGWYLLCVLTAGICVFFIAPYIETAKALFFNALAEETGAVSEICGDEGYANETKEEGVRKPVRPDPEGELPPHIVNEADRI